uniref:Uncharacterized protein n=1 Tax=Anguilla anguilla TaxID=7936 RepID=A0A0E9RH15_ANGAN
MFSHFLPYISPNQPLL